jgi:hypothetical protein
MKCANCKVRYCEFCFDANKYEKNKIPIAYDVDKVIEELKQRALPVLDEDDIESTFEAIMLEDAIEIVKNGLDKME